MCVCLVYYPALGIGAHDSQPDRTGQEKTHTSLPLTLNARSQSDDAPLHILSLYFLFLSTSLEPLQRTTT